MINVSNSIVIAKPIAELFAFTLDRRNVPKWQKSVTSVDAPQGPITKGYRVVNIREFMGQKMKTAFEFMEVAPNSHFVLKSSGGEVSIQVSISFEPVEAGTKMTTALQADVGGFFKVAEGLVAQQMQAQITEDGRNLKALLENNPGG